MINPWKASDLNNLIEKVKSHHKRLENASIVACFDDSKAFIKNKINLGKVTKFSPLAKLWQNEKHDFCLIICATLWQEILKESDKEALIDLLLQRCDVERVPKFYEENGKKKPIKDEYGRIEYSEEFKVDDEGEPKWRVLPLDLELFSNNIRKYGLWLEDVLEFKKALDSVEL